MHLVIDCRNFYDNRISGKIDDVEIIIFIFFFNRSINFRILFTGIIESKLKITKRLLTFGTFVFLAAMMFLTLNFEKKFVRSKSNSDKWENHVDTPPRTHQSLERSLIQPFRRFVASDRVNSKPIRCGLSDYILFHYRLKSDSIEA